jgi:hypothetical protein
MENAADPWGKGSTAFSVLRDGRSVRQCEQLAWSPTSPSNQDRISLAIASM